KPYSFPGGPDGGDDVEQTRQLLLRNTGECAVRNFGTWWMDLGAAGWFDDQRLWDDMKRLETLDNIFLEKPVPFRPEIAVFMHEPSMLAVAQNGNALSRPTTYTIREQVGRTGASYGQYLLDDFVAEKTNAKLNVFLSAWMLSPEERAALKKRCDATTATDIWLSAPGFLDTKKGGSLETMRELIGFNMKRVENVNAWCEPTELGNQLGLTKGFGAKNPMQPLFAVVDAKPDEILATYPDGSAAVVMRTNPATKKTTYFVGPPGATTELFRLAAEKAGVHLFTKTDCNVYANGNVLVVHAAVDGPTEIDFGQNCRVTDLLTGEEVGDGPKWTIPLRRGETRVWKYAGQQK
ncbi:MAG: hypothetical protein ACRCUY_08085, partial [Thermoguttaceae bacterium]